MIFGLTEQIFGLPNIELDLKSGLRIKSLVYRTLLYLILKLIIMGEQ